MKKAKYRGIPCYFNIFTCEIEGRNWFYDLLLDLNIWIDVNIVGVEGFPIIIEEE
jgi:hypothetical protein